MLETEEISRQNKGDSYHVLKAIANSTEYAEDLRKQNELDTILYHNVTLRMCDFLHKQQLWGKYEAIRRYWSEKSLVKSATCP
jgi:hypothetical protein